MNPLRVQETQDFVPAHFLKQKSTMLPIAYYTTLSGQSGNILDDQYVPGVPCGTSLVYIKGFPPLPIPVGIGEFLDVAVSHAEPDCSSLFVQLKSETNTILGLIRRLQELCPASQLLLNAPGGTVCGALFDDDKQWYRAIVLNREEAFKYKVYFLDYGNTALVHKDNIRLLSSEFMAIPPQAIQTQLRSIRPSPLAFERFGSVLAGATDITVMLDGSCGDRFLVSMFAAAERGTTVDVNAVVQGKANPVPNQSQSPPAPPPMERGPNNYRNGHDQGRQQDFQNNDRRRFDGARGGGGGRGGRGFGGGDGSSSETGSDHGGQRNSGFGGRNFGNNQSFQRDSSFRPQNDSNPRGGFGGRGGGGRGGGGFGGRGGGRGGGGGGFGNNQDSYGQGRDGFNRRSNATSPQHDVRSENGNGSRVTSPVESIPKPTKRSAPEPIVEWPKEDESPKKPEINTKPFEEQQVRIGYRGRAFIQHYESPDAIFLHLEEWTEILTKITEDIVTAEAAGLTPIPLPKKNDSCLAERVSEEGDGIVKTIYRAKITEISNDSKISVQFSDYGDSIEGLEKVYACPEALLEIPSLCVHCKIEGVTGTGEGGEWTKAAIAKAEECLFLDEDEKADVEFVGKAGKTYLIKPRVGAEKESLADLLIAQNLGTKPRNFRFSEPRVKLNTPLSGTVYHAEAPLRFYIGLDEWNDIYLKISEELTSMFTQPKADKKLLVDAQKGDACVAQFEGEWFRGEVEYTSEEGIAVRFVDFGNLELKAKEEVFAVEAEVLRAHKIALHSRLSGQPLEGWNEENRQKFVDLINEKPVQTTVLRIDQGICTVTIQVEIDGTFVDPLKLLNGGEKEESEAEDVTESVNTAEMTAKDIEETLEQALEEINGLEDEAREKEKEDFALTEHEPTQLNTTDQTLEG